MSSASAPVPALFPPPCSTREDYLARDYYDAEQSARELAAHLETATQCDACMALLDEDRFPVDGYVVCRVCAAHFVGAFLPEILRAAGETRWGAQS